MADIIMDEVFGKLKYLKTKRWGKRMEAPLFNSDGNLILVVQDNDQEGILDIQRETYKTFLQNEDKYIDTAIDYLLDYYKWNYEYIANIISDLTEEDHKDVVTEKQLFEMIDLWSLYICRDGSFGYSFGCCWDDENDLAVLLSEAEPRVISRTQLENLHKINDDTIGLLVHYGKNAWNGWKKHFLFGKNEHLEIELEGSVEDGITEVQKKHMLSTCKKKMSFSGSLQKCWRHRELTGQPCRKYSTSTRRGTTARFALHYGMINISEYFFPRMYRAFSVKNVYGTTAEEP